MQKNLSFHSAFIDKNLQKIENCDKKPENSPRKPNYTPRKPGKSPTIKNK